MDHFFHEEGGAFGLFDDEAFEGGEIGPLTRVSTFTFILSRKRAGKQQTVGAGYWHRGGADGRKRQERVEHFFGAVVGERIEMKLRVIGLAVPLMRIFGTVIDQ